MNIGITNDHRGVKAKQFLTEYLTSLGYNVIDYGTNSTESCDYVDYAYKLGNGILSNEVDFGIAICGTGIGMSIALNKMRGIYCAKVSSTDEAMHTRLDNNTNCVAIGENTPINEAVLLVLTFVTTEYSYLEKHNRRINKIKQIEEGIYRG